MKPLLILASIIILTSCYGKKDELLKENTILFLEENYQPKELKIITNEMSGRGSGEIVNKVNFTSKYPNSD
jgi:hypothetical protein